MSESGIQVNANKSTFENISSIANKTGFLFDHADENYLTGCAALQNTFAGFSFVSSSTNYAYRCRAVGTQGTGDTFGFIAQSGSHNIFESCVTDATRTNSGSCIVDVPGYVNTTAAGFVLAGEMGSKIWLCEAAGTTASTDGKNNAYGILLTGLPELSSTFSLVQIASSSVSTGQYPVLKAPIAPKPAPTGQYAVSWLNTNGRYYLAAGSQFAPDPVGIFEFDPVSLSLTFVTSVDAGPFGAQDLAWLTCEGKNYLGVAASAEVRIYDFNAIAKTTTLVTTPFSTGQTMLSLAWLHDQQEIYLAIGFEVAAIDKKVRILRFNPETSSLTEVASSLLPNAPVVSTRDLAWVTCDGKNYLASNASLGPNSEVHIYEFDPLSTTSLSSVASAVTNVVLYRCSLAWLVKNEKMYIAAASAFGAPITPFNLNIYEFDPLSTPSLMVVAADATFTSTVFGVAWLICNDDAYLAAAGSDADNAIEAVFKFDPLSTTSLVKVAENNLGGFPNGTGSVAWLVAGGKEYLGAGTSMDGVTGAVRIFEFQGCSEIPARNCIVKQSIVHGTTGGASLAQCGNGVGIKADSTQNYVAENVSCSNDLNYLDVQAKYLASQENARGVDNVDCSCTDPDEINLIESKLDLLLSLFGAVQFLGRAEINWVLLCLIFNSQEEGEL